MTDFTSEKTTSLSPFSLGVLVLLMLLPWGWSWLGMFVFQHVLIAIALYAIGACLIPMCVLPQCHKQWRHSWCDQFVWRRYPQSVLGLAILILLSIVIFFEGWHSLSPFLDPQHHLKITLTEFGFVSKPVFILFAVYFVTLNPIIEECFWRGFILRHLHAHTSSTRALVISSVAFGAWHGVIVYYLFHTAFAWGITLIIMLGGFIFGHAYRKTRSLVPAILLHSLLGDLPIVLLLANILYGGKN